MSEPRRLLDDGGSDVEVSILRAGRADGPSPTSRRKTLIALGLAGSATVATATSSAAAALTESAGTVALLKWVSAGVIGGLLTIGAVGLVGGGPRPPQSPPDPRPARQTPVHDEGGPRRPLFPPDLRPKLEAPAATVHEGAPVEPPPAPAFDEGAASGPRPRPPAEASARPAPSLSEEVATLDAARQALAGGDAGRALRALDDHDRRFAGGMLGPEALVLRVDALALRGDRASARRLGEAFLAAHPRSPFEGHVRAAIGAPVRDVNAPGSVTTAP